MTLTVKQPPVLPLPVVGDVGYDAADIARWSEAMLLTAMNLTDRNGYKIHLRPTDIRFILHATVGATVQMERNPPLAWGNHGERVG